MSETLGPSEKELGLSNSESRFGDKETVVNILENSEARLIGNIDDLYDVFPHHNLVEIADIVQHEAHHDYPNHVIPTYLLAGERGLLGVFKPYDGENEDVKYQTGIDKFYPRECAAYLASEALGYDIVPPTVLKEIDGRIGSLQLFCPPSIFSPVDKLSLGQIDLLKEADDYMRLALFDYIIASPDRHDGNYFVTNSNNIVAIDNSASFHEKSYRSSHIQGPQVNLTQDRQGKPKMLEIPEKLLAELKMALKNKEGFSSKVEPLDIPFREVDAMWHRVEDLVKTGVFLSPHNEKSAFGY